MLRNHGQGRHALGTYVVYIGGVEVPVNSIDIHFAIGGQDPTALISLAPHRLITRLGAEDRLEVQVFFLDQISYPNQPEYRLLFEGSISGWTFQRDAVQVSVGLTVQGIMNVLRALTVEYLTSVTALANYNPLQGTNIGIADSDLIMPWKLVFFGIGQEAQLQEGFELKRVKRPFDFVFNFLRLIFDTDSHKEFGSIPCAYFYGIYSKKYNFFYRFLPSPLIETTEIEREVIVDGVPVKERGVFIPVLDALQNQTLALATMARSAANQGSSIPAWETILFILQQLYFEVLQLPAPPCVYADMDVKKETFGCIVSPADERATEVSKTDRKILASAITKPNWFFGAVPMCNVVFPSMIQEVHFEENYWAQPTRLIVNDNSLFNMFGVSESAFGPLLAFSSAYPEAVEKKILERAYSGFDPALSGKNLLVWPEEFYKGVVESGIPLPEWLMFLTEAQLRDESSPDKRALGETIQTILVASQEFGREAETYTNEYEFRKLAEETERLEQEIRARYADNPAQMNEKLAELHKTQAEKKDKLLKKVKSQASDFKAKKKEYLQKLQNCLLAIKSLPVLSAQTHSMLNTILNTTDETAREDLLNRIVYYLMRDTRGSLYEIYRKYAAFEYWRLRGEQRAGALTMIFNPFVVPGFPIFVFDAAATGQHFFAYVTDVRHELSPFGRLTQINFTHVVLLSEYIELLFETKKLLKGMQREDSGTFLTAGVTGYEFARELYKGWYFEADTKGSIARETVDIEKVLSGAAKEKSVPDDVKLERVFIRDLIAVPLNPIMQLAVATQTAFGADSYFNALFWQFTNGHRESVFNPLTAINLIYYDSKTGKEIVNRLDSVIDYLLAGEDLEERLKNAMNFSAVRPNSKLLSAMDDYEIALRTVRRPVCSLSQYIDFIGATTNTQVNTGKTDRGLSAPVQLYTTPTECKKKYWYGAEPRFNPEDSTLVEPDTVLELPRHRRDWAKRLLEYRDVVAKEQKK